LSTKDGDDGMGTYGVLVVWGLTVMSFISPEGVADGKTPSSADMVAIEKLHHADVEATLSGDPKGLADLFAEDAILLIPGAPAVVGKSAILRKYADEKAAHPSSKVLVYKSEIKGLEVEDGWAFEWTQFDASSQDSASSEVKSFRGKSLRVLKRDPGGSWKFARVMWNLEY